LKAAFTALSSEVRTESASLRRGPSWKPALPETFHGKSKQDPYDWFFGLECFFEVAPDLRHPASRVTFAATLLRDDDLKWWRQTKTSGIAEEHDFDRFKAQLCSRFLTTHPVKYARDHLEELKQIKSVKAYSSIFRTVALSVTDQSPAESLDRYLRGLKKHFRAQVLLQKPANTEDALRLAEIYDRLLFILSEKKHYEKPGPELP